MTYSGSPNSYFKRLPDLDYPSLSNDRNSAYDYQVVKNIFKRAIIRDDVFDEATAFTKYSVQGDERPDQVAFNFYNDSNYDWVVLTTNNIIHVRDEWPMSNNDFLTYVNSKYTTQELTNIHHYETKIIRDSRGRLIQPKGLTVPAGHSITFLDNGVLRTESSLTSFTFFEHETNIIVAKSNINILRPQYFTIFYQDFEDVLDIQQSKPSVIE